MQHMTHKTSIIHLHDPSCQADVGKEEMNKLLGEGVLDGFQVDFNWLGQEAAEDGSQPRPKPKPKPAPKPKAEKSETEKLRDTIKAANRKVADLVLEARTMPEDLKATKGLPTAFIDNMASDFESWAVKFLDLGQRLQPFLVQKNPTMEDVQDILSDVDNAKQAYNDVVMMARKMMKSAQAKPKAKGKAKAKAAT